MSGKRHPISAELAAQGEAAIRAAMRKRQRRRNREYMQEWRADPKHREIERRRRDHDYTIKKLRSARRLMLHPYTGVDGQPQCGFCGQGRPVEIVERLRILETGDEEYIKVFVPYCGHC
jgi:hypothetical protein